MAKGFGGRGMPGMGGGMNMNMIKQAQKMQQDMLRMQQELQEKEYEAKAGGGVVAATVNGKHELKNLVIDPEAVDPDDVEMLQDMIMAAVNEAVRAADSDAFAHAHSLAYAHAFARTDRNGCRLGKFSAATHAQQQRKRFGNARAARYAHARADRHAACHAVFRTDRKSCAHPAA